MLNHERLARHNQILGQLSGSTSVGITIGGFPPGRWAPFGSFFTHLRTFRIALCLAAVAVASPTIAEASPGHPNIFQTQEIYSQNLKMFPKWRDAMERFKKELKNCKPDACDMKSWQSFIDGLQGRDLMTQLREVHREFNKRRYITDPVNWNLPDYWETPFQFLRRNGDCEDYAIVKYMVLRELGIPLEDMRIVVLQDLNLGIAHAILVVYTDGKALVLDNQISSIVPADSIRHYQPVYSVNEQGWWLHRS